MRPKKEQLRAAVYQARTAAPMAATSVRATLEDEYDAEPPVPGGRVVPRLVLETEADETGALDVTSEPPTSLKDNSMVASSVDGGIISSAGRLTVTSTLVVV